MADNSPDFDSMSPEELMAWMETLAERQGAVEGFTTEDRMEVDEIDPDSVEVEDRYIPYGKSESEWQELKKREEEEKAARRAQREAQKAAQQQQQQQPPPSPAQPTPPPPQPAQPAAELDPENMTPEQLMAWMETLAERQGATEGFTTEDRMEVDEIDPDSVEVEDRYIPYGMSEEEWAKRKAQDDQKREAARARRQQQQQPPPPPQPQQPEPEFELPSLEDELVDLDAPTELGEAADVSDGLAWLESLAAEQGDDLPELDLSGLGQELESLDFGDLTGEPADEANDPVAWLDNLAAGNEPEPEAEEEEESLWQAPPQQFAPQEPEAEEDVDPIEWLESLAKHQGADSEELTTDADLHIPDMEPEAADEGPGYADYTFETPEMELDSFPGYDDPEDPVAWLEGLAESQGVENTYAQDDDEDYIDLGEEPMQSPVEDDDIMARLNKAEDVDPNDMASWMSDLLEKGASRTDVPDYIDEDEDVEEDDDTPVQANLPDWLIDQVGPPPELESEDNPVEDLENLLDDLEEEPEPDEEMPDWLQMEGETVQGVEDTEIPDWLQDEGADDNTESLFVENQHGQQPEVTATDEFIVDSNDPWVEAFEIERREGLVDPNNVPDWYIEKLEGEGTELQAANLPQEADLPGGEPEDVPGWMTGEAEPEPVEEALPADISWLQEAQPAADEDMPDWLRSMEQEAVSVTSDDDDDDMPAWLRDTGIDDTGEVPSWLKETSSDEQPVFTLPEEEPVLPAPEPEPTLPPPAASSPAPVPVSNINVDEVLAEARASMQSGDLTASLQGYEAVVRSNTQLDQVINDLTDQIKDAHKESAPVYRVLGDGLMRQGRLQEALDTYRRALNLL